MRLPLFPLHTVLFPGGLLPLKVFEQRYIDMTKACLADERPFGVCLIVQGDEVARPGAALPELSTIGTTARITNWDMPQLGILHLATVGGSRFMIERHSVEPSGLFVGEVKEIAAEPHVALTHAQLPLVKLLELIATRVGPRELPRGSRLRQRLLGRLPTRGVPAAAAADQAEHARDQRCRCAPDGVAEVPRGSGRDLVACNRQIRSA